MELKSGEKLGPYEIVSRIGRGGMGEVWIARDPRLNRDVAIKISTHQFTDPFEREARAIAALNHPNVCTLHDIGPNYLVMELVEGPTLAERIAKGPIPPDEALAIAKQIADALEAAHEKAIVHRDLKPANIKIRPDGSVKVLDFGLAKAGVEAELSADSPTMTQRTQAGVILGTAGYMSPEQARGQVVDKRTDIWAFGVVLHEMLSGQRLFAGATLPDSLVAVLTKEPDLTLAPARTRRLLARCLEKDPKKRLRDIGDAMALVSDDPVGESARLSKWPWAFAAPFAVAALVLAAVHFREKPPAPPAVARFQIRLPENVSFTSTGVFALSPDGHHLAFSATGEDKVPRVWIQDLDSLEARVLRDTYTGPNPPPFFWSPDSRFVVLFGEQPETEKSGCADRRPSGYLRKTRSADRRFVEQHRHDYFWKHVHWPVEGERGGRQGSAADRARCIEARTPARITLVPSGWKAFPLSERVHSAGGKWHLRGVGGRSSGAAEQETNSCHGARRLLFTRRKRHGKASLPERRRSYGPALRPRDSATQRRTGAGCAGSWLRLPDGLLLGLR